MQEPPCRAATRIHACNLHIHADNQEYKSQFLNLSNVFYRYNLRFHKNLFSLSLIPWFSPVQLFFLDKTISIDYP